MTMCGEFTTLARLGAEIGVPFATLTRLSEELRVRPVVTLNGIPLFDERAVEKLRAAAAERDRTPAARR